MRGRRGRGKTLCETGATPIAEVAKKRVVTMSPLDTKRLKQLEAENGRLKKLLAEQDLEVEVLKEISANKW
jgi:hypothetical protein